MLLSPTLTSEKTLIDELLEEQQSLSAVERFAHRHDAGDLPALARHYRQLIPLSAPGPGEQYAFSVDLDACTACKACVVACHSLNGLDENESWRDVGTLGTTAAPAARQTVTTACHHCADPACANGCPTLAYEKDETTGIVRHLDDQCIGCKYCQLKCPYDVPKYNDRLGIVRKCDMCHDRLAAGEAPACVQSCPNEAIRITVVRTDEIFARSTREPRLLPGAFDSAYTRPATSFHSLLDRPDLEPADRHRLEPECAHLPLVVMLVLTQGALGLCLAAALYPSTVTALAAAALLLTGIAASILHLGRPTQAWRAFLGWRKSWLSREIIAFNLWLPLMFGTIVYPALQPANIALGAAAVLCSAFVYIDTRRDLWRASRTLPCFFGTTALAALALAAPPALFALALLAKLTVEMLPLRRARDKDWSPARHSARLLLGPLFPPLALRLTFAALAILSAAVALPAVALLYLLLGELCERRLFFQSVYAPKMPGAIRT